MQCSMASKTRSCGILKYNDSAPNNVKIVLSSICLDKRLRKPMVSLTKLGPCFMYGFNKYPSNY